MCRSQLLVFYLCILALLTVDATYLSGSLGKEENQKRRVIHDLDGCVIKTRRVSLVQTQRDVHVCTKKRLLKCIFSTFSRAHITKHTSTSHCGSIWIQDKTQYLLKRNIQVQVLGYNHIHFSILNFKLPISNSETCSENHISFVSSEFTSDNFCGIRLPWTFVMHDSGVSLHISLSSHKKFSFQSFYSGFRSSWISHLKQIHIMNPSSRILSLSLNRLLYIYNSNILGYVYNFYVSFYKFIKMYVTPTKLPDGYMRIYDGPGPLSRLLFNAKERGISKVAIIRSSSFHLFLSTQLNPNFTSFKLYYYSKNNVMMASSCNKFAKNYSISAKSSKLRNIVCMNRFSVEDHDADNVIFIKHFEFSGPNMIANNGVILCQFGGLIVYLNLKEYFRFCESIYGMQIYGQQQHFVIIFAWFTGYSHGRFNADIRITACRTFYFESQQHIVKIPIKKSRELKMDDSRYCTRYICSPPTSNIAKECIITVASPLGTAKIDIMKTETITSCDEDYMYNHYSTSKNSKMVTMQAVIFIDWPFSLTHEVLFQWNNLSGHVVKRFDYLHNMTLTMPQLCRKSREQWSAVLSISKCDRQYFDTATVNHLPALTDGCLFLYYNFQPSDKDEVRKGSYHDFFYKDSGHVNKGHLVNVAYIDCPVECRAYKYSTFVRSIDMTTIHEYTANVGDLTSTGRYHTGFRVSMLISNESCKSSTCNLRLVIQEDNFISSKDQNIQNTSLIFHKKR